MTIVTHKQRRRGDYLYSIISNIAVDLGVPSQFNI